MGIIPTGISAALINHLENNRRSLSLPVLVNLCNALQISPNYLLHGLLPQKPEALHPIPEELGAHLSRAPQHPLPVTVFNEATEPPSPYVQPSRPPVISAFSSPAGVLHVRAEKNRSVAELPSSVDEIYQQFSDILEEDITKPDDQADAAMMDSAPIPVDTADLPPELIPALQRLSGVANRTNPEPELPDVDDALQVLLSIENP